jgi:hypothetical protein
MNARLPRLVPAALAVLALGLGSIAQAGVLKVGTSAGAYATIGAAIAAAAEGDTILVEPGTYPAFSIDDKALNVLADPEGGAMTSSIQIQNLAAAKTCIVSGFQVVSASSVPPLYVSNCNGHVRLEALAVAAAFPGSGAGAHIENCPRVVFARGNFQGSPGAAVSTSGAWNSGGEGLTVLGGKVAAYDCSFHGGRGLDGFDSGATTYNAGYGGTGVLVHAAGQFFASGCSITAGDGGTGVPAACSGTTHGAGPGGSSGVGLSVEPQSPSSVAWSLGCTIASGLAGAGGDGSACGVPSGPAGGTSAAYVGDITFLQPTSRRLVAPTHERELHTIVLTVEGVPGDLAALQISSLPVWQLNLARNGVRTIDPSASRRFLLGTIPASGTLQVNLPIGDLGPGVDALNRYLQLVCLDSSGQMALGSPAALVLLDQQY